MILLETKKEKMVLNSVISQVNVLKTLKKFNTEVPQDKKRLVKPGVSVRTWNSSTREMRQEEAEFKGKPGPFESLPQKEEMDREEKQNNEVQDNNKNVKTKIVFAPANISESY